MWEWLNIFYKKVDTSRALSRQMHEMARVFPYDKDMKVEEVLAHLGVHGFIFLLLVLALLNLVIFMLPGFSIVFGLPMVIVAVQMLLGLKAPVFPDFIYAKEIKAEALHKGLDLAAVHIEKMERWVRPRLGFMTEEPWLLKLHSVVALLLSMMVAIPVPLLNLPPTFGVISLSIGLMQRDGAFILISYLLTGWSFWLYQSLGNAAQSFF